MSIKVDCSKGCGIINCILKSIGYGLLTGILVILSLAAVIYLLTTQNAILPFIFGDVSRNCETTLSISLLIIILAVICEELIYQVIFHQCFDFFYLGLLFILFYFDNFVTRLPWVLIMIFLGFLFTISLLSDKLRQKYGLLCTVMIYWFYNIFLLIIGIFILSVLI